MDHPDNFGIFLRKSIGHFACVVGRAVVDYDNFNVIAGTQQGLDTVVHKRTGIVAGDRKCDQLFHRCHLSVDMSFSIIYEIFANASAFS